MNECWEVDKTNYFKLSDNSGWFAERNSAGDRMAERVVLEPYVAMAETQQSVAAFRDRGAPAEQMTSLEKKKHVTVAAKMK